MEIILASGSPRRKELLQQIGLNFTVVTSDVDESVSITDPKDYVAFLSSLKADAVRKLIEKKKNDYVVIGADTIVSYKNHILTKPKDMDNAKEILRELSGNTHQVYTGVTLVTLDTRVTFVEKTDVQLYDMSDDEISAYVETGDCMDKAGAYGIQGRFAAFIKGIEGDYNNVVGLPVSRVYQELKKINAL
ncbi:MAG: Maf family protein [Eubacteriales bacterium]|nr:Maf family protein [Eubacteriales bacterium]